MKNKLKLLLPFSIFLLISISFIYSSHEENISRKVVLELFTATWCGPCARYGPLADKIHDQFPREIILVRNQVWQDGLDTKETNNRANFYGIKGVPSLVINGKYVIHPGYYNEILKIVGDFLNEKPLYIIKIEDLKIINNKVSFKIKIESLDKKTRNLKLFVILSENLVHYEGRNGEKEHRFVIRDYIPDERGTSLKINPKELLEIMVEYNLQRDFSPNKFSIVVFLQDISTKEIFNGEKVQL